MRIKFNSLIFRIAYGASGQPISISYNGNTYYYVLNQQGDVMALLDSSGNWVVKYTYDAWGNILTTTGSTQAMRYTLAVYNPLRYRGYVYDRETGLYYLNSRYYNAGIGRFINADAFPSTGQGVVASNMFAYCGNNPVSRVDIDGYFWDTIFDVISLCASVVEVACNPTNAGAWIELAFDVVDVAVPFVGGLGETVKAVRVTAKAIDGFGGLSKAKKYGIQAYNTLRKTLKGTGLQAHHIIEQRLVKHLGINVNKMLSVAVTATEHQKFTNKWREFFRYGMDYTELTRNDLWKAAQQIYDGYPELLSAAKKTLFG